MSISVTDPLGKAFEHTKRVLFQPFEAKKWFVLGFAAFLATLGGGGPGGFRLPGSGNGGSGSGSGTSPFAPEVGPWIEEHLALVVTLGIAVLVIVLAITLAIGWLSARGKFIFLDNVARNEAAIARPWREYAREGNRLFVFNLLFGLGVILAFLLIVGGGLLLAWNDIQANAFGTGAMLAVGVLLITLLPLVMAVVIISGVLQSWGIPLMYLRRIGAVAGLRAAFAEVVLPHLGAVVVYWLLLAALGLGAAVLAVVAIALTC